VSYNHGFETIKINNMQVQEETVIKQQTLFSTILLTILFSHSLSKMRQVTNPAGDCEYV